MRRASDKVEKIHIRIHTSACSREERGIIVFKLRLLLTESVRKVAPAATGTCRDVSCCSSHDGWPKWNINVMCRQSFLLAGC